MSKLNDQEKEIEYLKILKSHISIYNPVFIDIGAFVGRYTDEVLKLWPSAQMVLIEPNPKYYSFLTVKYPKFIVLPVLISDVERTLVHFYEYAPFPALSGIFKRKSLNQDMYIAYKILSMRLDNLVYILDEKVDFIKIDVEGAEYEILLGAEEILSNKKVDFMQIESGQTLVDIGIELKEIREYLRTYGYKMYDFVNGSLKEIDNTYETKTLNNYLITYKNI